jgi:glycosyltransferase involved in cell wall biosynthesis
MLCGTPIIGSDVGGIPELLTDGENGFISKPNVLDLRETIIRAVSLSHKEIELMRVRTYTRAQREFNPQKILGQIDLHYATVNHVTRKCGDNEIN